MHCVNEDKNKKGYESVGMKVWDIKSEKEVELEAWMRHCPWIITPSEWNDDEWDDFEALRRNPQLDVKHYQDERTRRRTREKNKP